MNDLTFNDHQIGFILAALIVVSIAHNRTLPREIGRWVLLLVMFGCAYFWGVAHVTPR